MEKNSVLFLLPCSNTKEVGGSKEYSSDFSITKDLSFENANKLLIKRKLCFDIIKTHQIFRYNQNIGDDDFNKHLIEGTDISLESPGGEMAVYLPAIKRYTGRMYSALGKDRLHLSNQTESHIIIVSSLYGLLKPNELIQVYSLNVNESHDVFRNWAHDNFLTIALREYIEKNQIKYLINFLSVRSYSQMIDWDLLIENYDLKIYYPFSKQFAGDTFHPTLGKYLAYFLSKNERKLLPLLKSKGDLFQVVGSVIPKNYEESG